MSIEIPAKEPNEDWITYQARVTNNLILYFPLGREPYDDADYPEFGCYLGTAIKLGWADNLYPKTDGVRTEFTTSELKESKTPREFVQELWTVTESLGIDLPTLTKKLNRWRFEPRNNLPRDMALEEEVCRTMIKIYVAMREREYSRGDLVR